VVAQIAQRSARPSVGWALWLVLGCAASAVVLASGKVQVTFKSAETCGFDNPHVADAKGCRLIDQKALMCNGFGVIDGVLFAGGCEAPAEVELLETRGTMPVAPGHAEEERNEERASPGEKKK
jgi:hypothetical protein